MPCQHLSRCSAVVVCWVGFSKQSSNSTRGWNLAFELHKHRYDSPLTCFEILYNDKIISVTYVSFSSVSFKDKNNKVHNYHQVRYSTQTLSDYIRWKKCISIYYIGRERRCSYPLQGKFYKNIVRLQTTTKKFFVLLMLKGLVA